MSERLADITARIEGVRQLRAVVNAMRGIAAARAQQARGQVEAVDGYARTIAIAIGRAASLLPADQDAHESRQKRMALVLFCAEQGFAGAFSERALDSAGSQLSSSALFLVGARGAVAAAERGVAAKWKASMPAHSTGVPRLADRIAEALYAPIASGEIDSLEALYPVWATGEGLRIRRDRLLPLDSSIFPRPNPADSPLINLPPDTLLSELATGYMHAQLCRAALHAYAAENEARMEAMASARRQIEMRLVALEAAQRAARQEEITAEIIELTAGQLGRSPGAASS